ELARRGFDMRVDPSDEYLARSHAAPPNAVHLLLRTGRRAATPNRSDTPLLAHVDLGSATDIAQMHQLDVALREFLTTPANLTASGRAAADHPSEPASQA